MPIASFLSDRPGRRVLVLLAALWLAGCDSSSNLTDTEYLAKARDLHAKGNDKAAVVEVRNALQKNPKNAEARILLATIYLDAGGGKQAQNELEIALQRGANVAQTKLPMARAYLLQGNYDGAATEAAVTLSTIGSDRARLLEVQGRARVAMQQPDRGCPLFDEARQADPQLMEAYWGAATCAAVKGDSELARSIVREALRIKPDASQSWVLLGDIERVAHHEPEAEKHYSKALELKKNNIDALLGRALAYVEERRLPEAEADLAQIDTLYPGNPLASYIRGIVRFRQNRFPEAKTAFETTLTTAPTHFPSILWLGLTNFAQRNYEVAATQLNQFLTLQPNAFKVRALLALARARLGGVKQANVDLSELAKLDIDDPQTLAMIGETHTFLGDPGTGAQFLARAVDIRPDDVQTRINLATSLLEKKDPASAIKQLDTILAKQPDNVSAQTLRIRALILQKDYAGALKRAEALRAQDPKSPVAPDLIGSVQLLQGDESAAKSTFEVLLAAHPDFVPAAINLALMSIRGGKLEDAQGYFRKALSAEPNSLAALLGLHSVERALGHASEAEKLLVQASKAHPDEVLPTQLLAQTYLGARSPRKALDVTDGPLRTHPSDAGLLETRGLAYLALNEPASAIVAFNKLAQVRGDSADAYVYVAQAQTALGDKAGTRAALATALKIDSTNRRARLAQGVMLLGEGRGSEATAIAKSLQRDGPNDADGFVLEASVASAAGKPRDSARILQSTIQRFPKSAQAHVALARAQSASGDLPAMVAGLEQWRKADAANPLAAEALGEAYLRIGNQSAALAAYQAQLALQPNDARALNNAAFLMRSQSPAEALALIERAAQLESSNSAVFDTMGQIQTEKGDAEAAVKAFSRANELAPKDGRIRYRLAVALSKAGQTALARRQLERLLATDPNFDGAADARLLLERLPRS